MSSETQKILTTDGIPLEESLKKAEEKNKIKSFLLVAPLLLFLIITYISIVGTAIKNNNIVFICHFESYINNIYLANNE